MKETPKMIEDAVKEELRKLIYIRPANIEDAKKLWEEAQILITQIHTQAKEDEREKIITDLALDETIPASHKTRVLNLLSTPTDKHET